MRACKPEHHIFSKWLTIIAAAALLAGIVSASEPASEFSETFCNFEGGTDKRPLPQPWAQNLSGKFKPFGKTEIIPAKFKQFRKALRITSTSAATDIYITTSIPVKHGDVLKV
ncbi:MAG: hypothetical protein E7055_11685, partial [Lentisphaerae bacterium]|nr:hypothetical protein [Lentisphaerota bacterium]